MAYLKLESVSKNFGSFPALSDVSLEAEAGEFVVLLGPSGCGKSTLLRLITGLIEEHDGEIHIKDRRVTDLDPKDRKVAMVFQSYALYPHLSVSKNISFGMEISRVPKPERQQRVLEAARALQLEELLDRLPSQLSGGQRQRVAIGRCLVREPDLFLFDEPLSNLDAKLRHETRIELKQLHQRLKTTTVYVTHDQHEAMTLGTKVVLMDKGRIVQTGTPLELYDHPVNRFAATFIGSPQINLIKGTLRREGDVFTFSTADARFEIPQRAIKTDFSGERDVEFGIRAENASLGTRENAHMHLIANYAEETGADTYVSCTLDGDDLTVRLPKASNIQPGDSLPIKWSLDNVLVFDLDSGERI